MNKKVPVLDHGYVQLIESWGSDERIIEAARISTDKGFLGWEPRWQCQNCKFEYQGERDLEKESVYCCNSSNLKKLHNGDERLLKYLYENKHSTPFEFAGAVFEIQAPIMVYREWHRHRTQCLDGGTMLYFEAPIRVRKGYKGGQKITISKLYKMWVCGEDLPIRKNKPSFSERLEEEKFYTVPDLSKLVERRKEDIRNNVRAGRLKATKLYGQPVNKPSILVNGKDWIEFSEKVAAAKIDLKPRIRKMYLRSLDESTNLFSNTHITDIVYSGKKEMFEVVLKDGKKIISSKDHKFIINGEWKSLQDGVKLEKHNDFVSWIENSKIRVNGLPIYQDEDWLRECYREKEMKYSEMAKIADVEVETIRKWIRKYGLQIPGRGDFKKGRVPWNKGKRYKIGWKVSEEHKQIIREARSGPKSNWWKGGISKNKTSDIYRWMSKNASMVHLKFNYTCQLCFKVGGKLQCHHIIPVWADITKGMEFDNLVSVCKTCHYKINKDELKYIEYFLKRPVPEYIKGEKRPSCKGVSKIKSKDIEIDNIKYVGVRNCFDVSVSGPYHNFVANGIVTHNSYAELSARYTQMPNLHYNPTLSRTLEVSKKNKQAGGITELAEQSAIEDWLEESEHVQDVVYKHYEKGLQLGIAKEIARINTPVSRYSRMRAQAVLRNWLAFLTLRMAPNAQWEIRQYANVVGLVLSELFPRTWELFIGSESE